MASESFIIYGDVNVQVTLTENSDGTLTFSAEVITEGENATGLIGDINALFFDAGENVDVSLLETSNGVEGGTMEVIDLEDAFKEESITKVDSYTNMNGEVVKEYGKFDGGVQFGTQGMAENDYQSVSFTLSNADGSPLSLADFSMQDFAIRLTSVGEEGGSRDGSLKLGTTSPDFPDDPEPPVVPDCDDVYFTTSADTHTTPDDAAFGDFILDFSSPLPVTSLLANNPGAMAVTSVDPALGYQVIEGTNGGVLVITEDGSFDFGADGVDFGGATDPVTTEFVYEVDGIATALCVNVTYDDGNGGGGSGFL